MLAETSSYPSLDLAFEIGVDRRTIYGWTNGDHKPSPLVIPHIDAAFCQVLGEDWTEQVDRALN